jgi:hypothetical protein
LGGIQEMGARLNLWSIGRKKWTPVLGSIRCGHGAGAAFALLNRSEHPLK